MVLTRLATKSRWVSFSDQVRLCSVSSLNARKPKPSQPAAPLKAATFRGGEALQTHLDEAAAIGLGFEKALASDDATIDVSAERFKEATNGRSAFQFFQWCQNSLDIILMAFIETTGEFFHVVHQVKDNRLQLV